MAKVIVAGATGYIGSHIAEQLGKANVQTAALVRNPSDGSNPGRVATLEKLKAAGVVIVEGSASGDVDDLAKILKNYDTVVSAISGPDIVSSQLALIEAAKKAGTIKRFFPSEFGGDYRVEEEIINPVLMGMLGAKQTVQKALKEAGIDYTLVVSNGFFGYILPQLGQLGPPPVPDTVSVYAGGNTRAAATAEEDIGKVVARAVADPRTANKKLVIKVNMKTQNEIIATWESLSGKTVTKKDVSAEDLDAQIKGAEGLGALFLGLIKLIWVDGANEKPLDGPAVYATELYPDLHFKTVEDYLKQFA